MKRMSRGRQQLEMGKRRGSMGIVWRMIEGPSGAHAQGDGELFTDETPVETRRIQWEQLHLEMMGQIGRLLVFREVTN